MMPLRSGLEMLREIRNDPNLSSLPVILISARGAEESKIEASSFSTSISISVPIPIAIPPFAALHLHAFIIWNRDCSTGQTIT